MDNGMIFNSGSCLVRRKKVPLFEPLRVGAGVDDRHLLVQPVKVVKEEKKEEKIENKFGVEGVTIETGLIGKRIEICSMPVGILYRDGNGISKNMKVSSSYSRRIAEKDDEDWAHYECAERTVLADPTIQIGDEVICLPDKNCTDIKNDLLGVPVKVVGFEVSCYGIGINTIVNGVKRFWPVRSVKIHRKGS